MVPKTRLFILVLAVLWVTVLAVVLKASPMGRRIRAVVQNRDLAETSGISSRRTDITTFFIGSGLAGGVAGGVALTLIGSTSPTTGQSYLIDAFLVVVVGGLGQIKGTVIAAFSLGLLNSFIEYSTTASLAKVIVFVVIVIFLQARPPGPVHRADKESRMRTLVGRWQTWAGFAVAAVLLFGVAPAVLSSFRLGLLGQYLCYAIVAAGIGLAWGRGGMLTLGQGVFFGLGAT